MSLAFDRGTLRGLSPADVGAAGVSRPDLYRTQIGAAKIDCGRQGDEAHERRCRAKRNIQLAVCRKG